MYLTVRTQGRPSHRPVDNSGRDQGQGIPAAGRQSTIADGRRAAASAGFAILDTVSTSEETEEKKHAINWMQVAAGALAAVSSAVLLSTLGVAGTMIGAALGSVFASVGSAFYGRTLDVSRQQVAAQAAALRRVTTARTQLDEAAAALDRGDSGAETTLHRADQALDEAEQALQEAAEPDGTPEEVEEPAPEPEDVIETAKRLPWKRVALVAAAVFVVAMIAITSFEMLTGRAVSAYTGGSDPEKSATVPGLGRGGEQRTPERPQDEPTDDVTPSEEPTETPTEELSEEPEETEEPTDEPTDEPTEEPTDGTTSTPSPTVGTTPTSEPEPTPGTAGP